MTLTDSSRSIMETLISHLRDDAIYVGMNDQVAADELNGQADVMEAWLAGGGVDKAPDPGTANKQGHSPY